MNARGVLAAVTTAATLASATTAAAAPWKSKDKRAAALLGQAVDAAEAGDFTTAAALSLRSFEAAPSLLALWNAGQAHMAIGAYTRALDLYDRALADADLPRDRRPQLEDRRSLARAFLDAEAATAAGRWDDARAAYLGILDRDGLLAPDRQHAGEAMAKLAEQRAAAERAAADAAKPAPPPPQPDPATSSTAAPPEPTPTAAPPLRVDLVRGSRWDDSAALVIAGVGVVAIGVGVGLYIHAGQLEDRADAASTPDEDRADLRDRADTEHTAAPILMGLGAAVAIAGVVKFAIPPDAQPAALASTTIAPARGGVVVVFGGRF